MRLIIYCIKLLLCLVFAICTLYIVTLLPDQDLLISLTIWFFINMITAAYACEMYERIVKHIKQRRKYYAKNSKNN